MHNLGNFPYTENQGARKYLPSVRNMLLEEGLADSIAHFVRGTDHNCKYAVKKEDTFNMYKVDSNFNVDESNKITHTYTFSGNIINVFKYIGCYNELIHSHINSDFTELKLCMTKKVNNGDEYYNKLFTVINNMYLYMGYPNTFYTNKQYIEMHQEYLEKPENTELKQYMMNTNLNDVTIEYADLVVEIMNNKIDNTYSACDYYKTNAILYNTDNKEYKTRFNCK